MAALAALTLLTPGLAAQDDEAEAHPAHIHSGTCAELGDVVLPLTDVAAIGGESERTGAASAIPVKNSVTVVDMPLQEIIDGGHAINVHLSADEIDTYIACGDIGGAVTTIRARGENRDSVCTFARVGQTSRGTERQLLTAPSVGRIVTE